MNNIIIACCVFVLAIALNPSNLHAQKKKPAKKTAQRIFTTEERQSLYMPVNDPKPCSVFLLDFGSSKEKVLQEASRIGLVIEDTIDFLETQYRTIKYRYSEPEYAMYYTFGFDADGKYQSFTYETNKTEVAYAVRAYEQYLQQLWLHWDAKKDNDAVFKECPHNNERRFAYVSRDEKEVRFYVERKTDDE